jgi:hypothetical protein
METGNWLPKYIQQSQKRNNSTDERGRGKYRQELAAGCAQELANGGYEVGKIGWGAEIM